MSYEFDDLPFRMIIFSIMPYHLEVVNVDYMEKKKDVVLFGYFKRDPLRKIFFLFPSLSINSSCDFHKRVCIGINTLHHLVMDQISVQELVIILTNSHLLIKLNSLFLHFYCFDDDSRPVHECKQAFGNLFTHEEGFQSLTHLVVFFYPDGTGEKSMVDMSTWHQNGRMWKNIESLELNVGDFEQRDVPLFTPSHSSLLSNIKRIDLGSIHLSTLAKVPLPSVVFVTLENIKNLMIIPTRNNISLLEITDLDPKIVKPMFELSHMSLEEIQVIHGDLNVEDYTNNCYPYLFSRDSPCRIQNLKKLKRLSFTSMFWNPEEVSFSLPLDNENSIDSLFFCNCPYLDEGDLFPITSKFSRLQELALWSIPTFGSNLRNTTLPFSKVLQKLSLHGCQQASDFLFKNFEWSSLSDLSVSNLPLIQGHSWNRLPSLRIFQISNCNTFNIDHFFSEHDELSELECILITNMDSENNRGDSWCKEVGESLKKIEINYCDSFTDNFFRSVSLPKLQILSLQSCSSITGCMWKIECKDSLEIIIVDTCEKFGNEFFVEQLMFPKIRRIELVGVLGGNIGSQKWNTGEIKMPELESLEIFRSKTIGDEVFQSKSIVEDIEYIHIHKCDKIRCFKWAYMGHLKKIKIRKIDICEDFLANKPYDDEKVIEDIRALKE